MSKPSALSASDLLSELSSSHPEQALNFALLYETCKHGMEAVPFAIPSKEELNALTSDRGTKLKDLPVKQVRTVLYDQLGSNSAAAFLASKLSDDPLIAILANQLSTTVVLVAKLYGIGPSELSEMTQVAIGEAKEQVAVHVLQQMLRG